MDTILEAWDEVTVGVRTATGFAALLATPEVDDLVYADSDAANSLYEDLRELAGMFAEEDLYEDQYLAITGDHIEKYRAGRWLG